jgi:hypothetical protein
VTSPPRRSSALHAGDGHAGITQPEQELNPGHVAGGIAALPARGAAHRADEIRLLVIAQRVSWQAGPRSDFGDRQSCRGQRLRTGHVINTRSWSALQRKPRPSPSPMTGRGTRPGLFLPGPERSGRRPRRQSPSATSELTVLRPRPVPRHGSTSCSYSIGAIWDPCRTNRCLRPVTAAHAALGPATRPPHLGSRPWPGPGLSSGLIHPRPQPFTGGHPARMRAGHEQ